MTAQRDMFLGDPDTPDPVQDEPARTRDACDGDTAALKPLAVPCGFRNRGNAPCRRLADRPVMMDGRPFVHRGHQLLHCRRPCWLDDEFAAEYPSLASVTTDNRTVDRPEYFRDPTSDDDPDANRDPEDPGYSEMPDYDDGRSDLGS